jgi:nucleoid-associated protein YgaU
MASEKQITGTIALLGAAAVAVVTVLLGVLYWEKIGAPLFNNSPQASVQPLPGAGSQAQVPAKPQTASANPQAAPAGEPPKPASDDPVAPSFDVVRIEPDGESVIAGRAAPGATIELLRGDHVHARAVADASGLFAIVPPPLPPGSHQIVLQSIAPDGARQRSRESVTVVLDTGKTRPLVALAAPDKPTVLLSNPQPPEAKPGQDGALPQEAKAPATPAAPAPQGAQADPAAPTAPRPEIKIVTVEAEDGRLFVSGLTAPGATIRLYLNESFVAPGGAGGDGKVSFAIGGGVKPGEYRVRLDDVDPVSGQVKSRAEVGFSMPAQVASAQSRPAASPSGTAQAPQGSLLNGLPSASNQTASAAPDAPVIPSGTVMVPNITTAIVSRGDNLWRISHRTYGKGYRYTVIYGANQEQIRNPNLIYPGQVFVLPNGEPQKTN